MLLHWNDGKVTTVTVAQAKQLMKNTLIANRIIFVEYFKGY